MSLFRPARPKVEENSDDEILCDLDVVLSRRVTFVFRGKRHALLPITTERFFEFWHAMSEFKKKVRQDPVSENSAYLAVIKPVCDTLTLKDVTAMSIHQKCLLLEHIASKIAGTKLGESGEKKKPGSPTIDLAP